MATAPAPVRPLDLVLRCYARRTGSNPGRWIAHCVDLDLWASGPDIDSARKGLEDAIVGYLETVLDTEDRASIPRLLQRRAPWYYVAFWHFLAAVSWFRRDGGPLGGSAFEEHLPFHLSAA